MDLIWIPISMFGGIMQALRTAAQKSLNSELSTWSTTYVRSLFGLPLISCFLLLAITISGQVLPEFTKTYILYSLSTGVSQVIATYFLIKLFTLRNFAVGTMLAKTDLVQAAVIGSLFFSESITLLGWVAITLTGLGVVSMSTAKIKSVTENPFQASKEVTQKSIALGISSGFLFCLSYLFLREATLSIEGPIIFRSAWTIFIVTTSQTFVLGLILLFFRRSDFSLMRRLWRPCGFVGITSGLGSICWFTAMAIQNASYVKAVGQIEVIFTCLISVRYFGERITSLELLGMAGILIGVMILIV